MANSRYIRTCHMHFPHSRMFKQHVYRAVWLNDVCWIYLINRNETRWFPCRRQLHRCPFCCKIVYTSHILSSKSPVILLIMNICAICMPSSGKKLHAQRTHHGYRMLPVCHHRKHEKCMWGYSSSLNKMADHLNRRWLATGFSD